MNIANVKMVSVQDWDKFVSNTYGRIYSFQQQEGCKDRGVHKFDVPGESNDDDMNENIEANLNTRKMGVKLATWLARDPDEPLTDHKDSWKLTLWWERNFYPDIQALANDLHAKGLLEAGKYAIDIDW